MFKKKGKKIIRILALSNFIICALERNAINHDKG